MKNKNVMVKGKYYLEYCYPNSIKDIRILLENGYRIENHNEMYSRLYYGRSIVNERIINSL